MFLLLVSGGALLGFFEDGLEGIIIGAGGGFVFWLFLKIVGWLNKNTDKIESMVDVD